MVDTRIIVAGIAVAVVLLLLLFWPFASKTPTHTSTYVPPATNTVINSSTALPPKIEYYAINYQWIYNGPSNLNGISCFYASHTTVVEQTAYLNASQDFYLVLNPSSNQCAFQINSVNSSTPGFSVVSTEPTLPFELPGYSQAEVQVNLQAPDANYFGPLTLTIHYG